MRAVGIEAFGGREQLKQLDLPVPEPGPGEVRLAVRAAGVNPVDWKIREGWLKDFFPYEFPIVPGWDAAGTIDAAGEEVSELRPGDEVYAYCRKPVIQWGAYAEYIVLPASHVAAKPRALSMVEAGAVPLAALTAMQSLYDAAELREGETVLIHAAAGGVGSFAVQLARMRGARVIGTASEENHEYLRSLGCDHPIDYTATDVAEAVRGLCPDGVDVVYDCVGGPALHQSPGMLNRGGRLVSIVDKQAVDSARDRGVDAKFVFVEPSGEQLRELAGAIDEGTLKPSIAAELPLEDAARAHEMVESHHTRGKIVLTV